MVANNQGEAKKEQPIIPPVDLGGFSDDQRARIARLCFESLPQEEKEKRAADLEEFKERLKGIAEIKDMSEAERTAKVAELDKEIKDLKDSSDKIKSQIIKGRFPQLISLELERRRDIDKEYAEITKLKILNAEELIVMYEDAVAEHNIERAFAILKKLAYDANFNEVLNYYGYRSNWQGMHQFFREKIIEKLGVGEQVAFSVENDISYGCEAVNHWDQARLIGRNPSTGLFFQMNEDEHVESAAAEIKKMDPRTINRNFNRLAYGGEDQDPDDIRKFHLGKLGIRVLLDNGEALAANKAQNVRREMNSNAVGHLGDNLKILKESGVSYVLLDAIKERAEAARASELSYEVIRDLQKAETVKKYDMELAGLHKFITPELLRVIAGDEEGRLSEAELRAKAERDIFNKLADAGYQYVHEILSQRIDYLAEKVLGIEYRRVLKLREALRDQLIEAEERKTHQE